MKNGADIVVTGTIVKEDIDPESILSEIVQAVKK